MLFYSSFAGLLGLSTTLSVIHDILILSCAHIFLPYTVVAFIYAKILKMLGTLVNLFNGKKFNVMRNRVDSNNFSIQEFYLGVLIVALILFLLPTLAMYYFMAFISFVIYVLII